MNLALVGAAALLAVAGCSAPPPPPPPPTMIEVSLSASADVNANAAGQGAPVVIRLYQLGSAAGFEKAEFFRLFNGDSATLGADLVKRDEYLLAPGASRTVSLAPEGPVHALGVFAGYRDFQHVAWRGTVAIPAHQTTTVTVAATAAGVTVTAAVAKPAP